MGGGKQPSKICTVTREELHVPGITRLPKELNTREEEKENIKGKWKNPPTPPTPLHLLYSWVAGRRVTHPRLSRESVAWPGRFSFSATSFT